MIYPFFMSWATRAQHAPKGKRGLRCASRIGPFREYLVPVQGGVWSRVGRGLSTFGTVRKNTVVVYPKLWMRLEQLWFSFFLVFLPMKISAERYKCSCYPAEEQYDYRVVQKRPWPICFLN